MRAGWGLEDETHLDPSAVSSLWHWLHNCMHVIKMCRTQHTCVNRLYHNTGKMKYGHCYILPMLLNYINTRCYFCSNLMKDIVDLFSCSPSFLSPILQMGHRTLYALCMLSTAGLHSQPLYCTSIHSYLKIKRSF